MKFFVDTADVDEIRKANDMGVICGVTTNPSPVSYTHLIKRIIQLYTQKTDKKYVKNGRNIMNI